jgi:hypothetical protein
MKRAQSALDQAMISAWHEAAADLGFRLQAPYDAGGGAEDAIWVEGFLPDFSTPNGMIFTAYDEWPMDTDYWCSGLTSSYHRYDRAHFIDTLQDWGWCGAPDEKPEWLCSDDGSASSKSAGSE